MWQNDFSDWKGGCLMMIPEVAMPSWFREMNPMPGDPPDSEVYCDVPADSAGACHAV